MAVDGKDAEGRGAKDAPLATAVYALARMRPGDVLVLKAGTYKQQIVIDRSGTSKDFLAVVAEAPPYDTPPRFPTPGQVIIDASGLGDQPAIVLKGCGHVRVAGIKVIGSKSKTAAVELQGTRDCVLEYIFVDSPSQTGIAASGRENTLYECRVVGGQTGYMLSGSLTDVRWCASEKCSTGFRSEDKGAGNHYLQNRHIGAGEDNKGFLLGNDSSDIVLDGNWAGDSFQGFGVGGQRILLVNNNAFKTKHGIIVGGKDIRLLNNSVLEGTGPFLYFSKGIDCVLVLNNIFQGPEMRPSLIKPSGSQCYLDYNVYSGTGIKVLESIQTATGFDRNSIVAPMICQRMVDKNGRQHLRAHSLFVSSMTHDFNVGPDSLTGAPYSGGGWFVPDVPDNWKPSGDPANGLYEFSAAPNVGAAAAYCYWYCARVDYRQKDGKRKQMDMVKLDLPPGEIPPGTFCQDTATGKLYFRMPSDAAEPCPIGKHHNVPPAQAIGYYVGRNASGPKEKYFGKLVTAEMAAEMEKDGVKEVDAVANVLTCLIGTPGLEMAAPISGLARDADSMPRPGVPGGFPTLGWYNGPGAFDIGSWECGYYTP